MVEVLELEQLHPDEPIAPEQRYWRFAMAVSCSCTSGSDSMRSLCSRELASWAAFFGAWWRESGGQPMTAGELMAIAEEALPEAVGNGSERSRSTRLGLALGR